MIKKHLTWCRPAIAFFPQRTLMHKKRQLRLHLFDKKTEIFQYYSEKKWFGEQHCLQNIGRQHANSLVLQSVAACRVITAKPASFALTGLKRNLHFTKQKLN